MAILHYTEATGGLPNSGRLSGTDGDLVGILDIALVANGWTIDFSTGNARIYRAASGNRFRLYVNDAAAISGDARLSVVRGCESASAASNAGIVDPFPTAAKIADGSSNWIKSTTASTTARNFDIFVAPTWVAYFINFGGVTNIWDFGWFGDISPALSGDSYSTVCVVRNVATTATISNSLDGTASGTGNLSWNLCRSYDGTVKATTGGVWAQISGKMGTISVAPQAQLGPSTGIDRFKAVTLDTGSATTSGSSTLALPQRGYIPNIWVPLHGGRGSVNSRDTFTDTSYNASSAFTLFCVAAAAGSGFVIMETSDTWSPPSG